MPIDPKRARLTFRRLGGELAKLSRKPVAETVHKFRTNSRRVEALLREIVPELSRNDKKLLKLLGGLRKKAGRVRDLDVQIGLLRNLKIPGGNGQRAQFLEAMVDERVRREEKLAKATDSKTSVEIRKRLKHAVSEIDFPSSTDPLALTLKRLAQLGSEGAPLTERTLHRYRIIGKRARYVAELADNNAEAHRVVEQLKHLQDIIGDWHDWLKLTDKAEKLFGGVRESSLVALLRNVTRAKFRESLGAVAQTRTALAQQNRQPPEAPSERKSATKETIRAEAAVA